MFAPFKTVCIFSHFCFMNLLIFVQSLQYFCKESSFKIGTCWSCPYPKSHTFQCTCRNFFSRFSLSFSILGKTVLFFCGKRKISENCIRHYHRICSSAANSFFLSKYKRLQSLCGFRIRLYFKLKLSEKGELHRKLNV